MTETTLTPPASPLHQADYQPDPVAVARVLGSSSGVYSLLDQFGVIDATGVDAVEFLHNQVTNDVTHLALDQSALGGYCSPKGRLIASFLYWLQGAAPANGAADAPVVPAVSASVPLNQAASVPGVRLLIAADIREAIQKRLSMFVLRSKVKLTDATPGLAIIGLAALSAQATGLRAVLTQNGFAVPEGVRGRTENAAGTLLRLPDAAGTERYLLLVPREGSAGSAGTNAVTAITEALGATLSQINATTWDWLDIQSGEPRITAATQDSFVPQMINFEALGGINFRKGCYPGQEVVARSQYRGTIKRRATIAHADVAKAGDEVFDAADPLQPCGHVINAAPSPLGDVICLVELKLSVSATAQLHVATSEGPSLTIQGLPYTLPDLNA